MATSPKLVRDALIRVCNQLFGSDAPEPKRLVKRFIQPRQGGSKGIFPLGVVDVLPMGRRGLTGVGWSEVNDDGKIEYQTQYKQNFLLQVHGSETDDVLNIVKKIRDKLLRPEGLRKVADEVSGEIQDISAPGFSFLYRQSDYEEVARITIAMSITEVEVDEDSEVIVDVEMTGDIDTVQITGNGEVEVSITQT